MAGRSLLPSLPDLDRKTSARAVALFNKLRLPDVPGQPLLRDAAGEWLRDICRALFGSILPDGSRAIREVFVLAAKKNSKTSGGAAIMLTALLMNKRPRAEFLIVAPTQQISDLSFQQVAGMVQADEFLSSRFAIRDHIKRIEDRKTGAFLAVKSWSPNVVTGTKPSGILLDELHVQQEQHNADRVIGQIRGGMVSQPEAFLLSISTQSERQPCGIWKAELQKARQVRDGKLRGVPVLPLIYEFPKGVDWKDQKLWPLVLPNEGFSITAERLVPDFQAAEASGPEELLRWLSQHLSVEVGLGLKSDAWVGAEFWEQAGDPTLTLDEILAASDCAVVGIDGGGRADLLGLCVLGRDKLSKKWLAWGHAWAHPSLLAKHKDISPRLLDFQRDGDLTVVDGEQDIRGVVEIVKKVQDAGLLGGVGCDPYGIGSIPTALAEIGVEPVGISQGWKLTASVKTVERLLSDGNLIHCAQPVMGWCVANARVEPKGQAVAISKSSVSSAQKIDTLIALLNAAALMSTNPEPVITRSIYDRFELADLLAPVGR